MWRLWLSLLLARQSLADVDHTPVLRNDKPLTKISDDEVTRLKEKCASAAPVDGFGDIPVLWFGTQKTIEDTDDFAFAVALANGNETNYYCTGTLISNKHVLTASHCVVNHYVKKEWKKGDIFVTLGSKCILPEHEISEVKDYVINLCNITAKNIAHIKASAIVTSKQWFENAKSGDYAIIELEREVDWKGISGIEVACLPKATLDVPLEKKILKQFGYGWNKFSAEHMSPILNVFERCSLTTCPKYTENSTDLNHEGVLCPVADGPGHFMDYGDSGSGLIINSADNPTTIGILSYKANILPPSNISYYTDVRLWVKDICEQTGICYMT